ncbi:hypothetical protein IQ264_28150 [Phormidium sp. LEGE 05292]|uniref:hypothetical protein n=1 Tax=[Phormidium] sp. LEGE 05292 TaxID=767427 RepID=UPI0018811D40|nr:hypothetical protein [Phormidium sp. LEGE 05292]MBE9229282.1 hypothetical protein [Phormidium sp. LEGE 05292]
MKSNWMIFGFYFGLLIAVFVINKNFNIDDKFSSYYKKFTPFIKISFKLALPILCFPLLFAYLFYIFGIFIEKLSTSFNTTILEILLRGIAPLVTAGIAAYIAYQQYKVNRTNLQLSLYNKRFVLYHSIIELLSEIAQTRKIDIEQIEEYKKMRREASFIFNDQTINEWLEETYNKFLKFQKLEETIKLKQGFPTTLTYKKEDGTTLSINCDDIEVDTRGMRELIWQLEIIKNIEDEKKIEKIFRPYLEIKNF